MSIWKRQKKAITFAELMISLVVISVVAAVLYPTIAQFTPNTNKPLFKAAHNTLSTILYEIVNESIDGRLSSANEQVVDAGGNLILDASGNAVAYPVLCRLFCQKANVVPDDVEDAGNISCDDYCADGVLTTSNGMRWVFSEFGTYNNPAYPLLVDTDEYEDVYQIIVDVNSSNNRLPGVGGISINTSTNGVFYYTPDDNADTGIYYQESGCTDSAGASVDCHPTLTTSEGFFNLERIKTQDTFVILVDINGKIVAMSPAGWAHLENSSQSPD